MNDWPVLRRYEGDSLKTIVMPIGGIGTGFFGLGGRGQLTDWQLMSRPNRGFRPMYSHLLLHTNQGGDKKLRVLEGDIVDGFEADTGNPTVLAGIPRFKTTKFEASYPFGRVHLEDDHTPVDVEIEGFNPLIPHDTASSSLPFGILTVKLTNKTDKPIQASMTFLGSNIIGADGVHFDLKDNVTETASVKGWKGMLWSKAREAKDPKNGTMVWLCDADDVVVARRWAFRDRGWNGETLGIIDSLLNKGQIDDDHPLEPCPPSPGDTWDSSLTARFKIEAKGVKVIRFLVAWHFPWRNLSESGWLFTGKPGEELVRNWYATHIAEDAVQVADRVIPQLDDLRKRTVEFVKKVVGLRAPTEIREAALFNLAHLKAHTCFRLEDGGFYGFEGCSSTTGCCAGSCTHVWNYEESLVHLFPELHRSMVENHAKRALAESGAQRFRIALPLVNQTWGFAAADGQMGLVVRIYQQYLVDKNLEWLKSVYPSVKKMIEFAWLENGWDGDKDGVMEGSQHNTYDVEFFGPNPMCTGWYIAALKATSIMADLCGDSGFSKQCEDLANKGSAWVDDNLYTGHYYVSKIVDKVGALAPMTSAGTRVGEFQVGIGCLVDQLVGQYKAFRVGMGYLFEEFHVRTATLSIFKNNFREHFRDHYNNMRTFAYGDEKGTLICSYPEGGRLSVPFPYWSECMTGFEYQLAVLLIDTGHKDEGFKVAKAIRDRHAGHNRNPFNEPECGSYYARSMAAWALLEAWTGKDPLS